MVQNCYQTEQRLIASIYNICQFFCDIIYDHFPSDTLHVLWWIFIVNRILNWVVSFIFWVFRLQYGDPYEFQFSNTQSIEELPTKTLQKCFVVYAKKPKEISMVCYMFNIYLNVCLIHQIHLYILRFFFRLMMLKENIVTVTNSNDFCAPQLILCPMMMLVMIS